MLTAGVLMANTTYRVNSTLDMSGAIRGAQGTVLLCVLVEVCIRVPAGQTLQVSSLQLAFQGTQPRTVFLTSNNGKVDLTNITISTTHSGFLLIGATGDLRSTMRGVVARSVFLIAVNDTQGNSQIDLDDVSTTSNNAIVMNGGTSNGSGVLRVADCEFNGTGGSNTIIRVVNTSESVAVFREMTIDRTTFRGGIVELRARQAIRFTDVTTVGVVANVASGGEIYVTRTSVRSVVSLAGFVVQQARIVRFDRVDVDQSRSLTQIVTSIEELDLFNLDIGSTQVAAIEMTSNASITTSRSQFQNITARTCLLLKVNGQVATIANVTVRNAGGAVSASIAVFANTTGLSVSNWLVDNCTCSNHVLEFVGNRTASVSIADLTITNSSVARVVSIANQPVGPFVLNRTRLLSSRVRKMLEVSANSASVSVDLSEIANSSLAETALLIRSDASVSVTSMAVRDCNLTASLFSSENSGTITLLNVTVQDVRALANQNLLSIGVTSPALNCRVTKVILERCNLISSVLLISHANGQRGTVNITEFSVSGVRNFNAALRLSTANSNVTLFNVSFTDVDAAIFVGPAGSFDANNVRVLRARSSGISVSNVASTAQLSNVEISDTTMACSSQTYPLYVASIAGAVTLTQLTLARLRCFDNSTANAVAMINTRTANVQNAMFVDNSVPVVYLWVTDAVLFDGCRFEGNSAIGAGVVLISSNGIVTFTESLFLDNTATVGAFALTSGSVTVTGTRFFNNTGTFAGAIRAQSGTLIVDRSVFRENRATNGTSGAVSCTQTRACSISNSDFVGNSVSADANANVASALHVYQDNAALSNLTIRDNRLLVASGLQSASVYLHFLTSMTMVDACICNNLDEVSLQARDLGCQGSRPVGNWSATATLVAGSDCLVFTNASSCSSSSGCALRLPASLHIPPRTTIATTTTTTTTTTRNRTPSPTMGTMENSGSTTPLSSLATNVTTMALTSDVSTNVGMIVGIVLGSIAFVALIALFVVGVVFRSRKKNREVKEAAEETSAATSAREFVSARDEYGSLADLQTQSSSSRYNSTFRLLS